MALPLAGGHDSLAPLERRSLVVGVAGLHLLALWGLLQVSAVQDVVRQVAPIMVDFISIAPPRPLPAPPPPTPVPQPRVQRTTPTPPPVPVIAAAPSPETPAASLVVPPPSPVPVAAPPVVAAPPAPAAPPATPAAPPAPKAVPASVLRYTVPPPIEVPMASRRLQETGTVWLRVVFDATGRPRQVVVHKSSGFGRLDEQAMQAMRQARITPYLDKGVAVDITVNAPLQYELESPNS